MAVTLFHWGLLFYSPARAMTVNFTPATKDVGAKTWLVASYDDDDDGGYDDGGYDDGGDDDGSSSDYGDDDGSSSDYGDDYGDDD